MSKDPIKNESLIIEEIIAASLDLLPACAGPSIRLTAVHRRRRRKAEHSSASPTRYNEPVMTTKSSCRHFLQCLGQRIPHGMISAAGLAARHALPVPLRSRCVRSRREHRMRLPPVAREFHKFAANLCPAKRRKSAVRPSFGKSFSSASPQGARARRLCAPSSKIFRPSGL